jgi:hypothetical protein
MSKKWENNEKTKEERKKNKKAYFQPSIFSLENFFIHTDVATRRFRESKRGATEVCQLTMIN